MSPIRGPKPGIPARQAPAPLAPAAPRTAVSTATVTLAPDGMAMNRPGLSPATPLTRRDVVALARAMAPVPQRVQVGPTCGLYALGMVMDAWHLKDKRCASPLVQDADLHAQGKQFNFPPTTSENLLDYAKAAGFTSQGEMFTAKQLAQTAAHFGYTASVHHEATLTQLYAALDKGHPVVVAFDVDFNGNPGDYGGMRAHYAVMQGYFDQAGERYLVARHGWGVETDHVWKASDFERSWKALKETDYYGTPGDGVIPKEPTLREPSGMKLPDVGRGRAGILESLAMKMVEVVPKGVAPTGGEVVRAPG